MSNELTGKMDATEKECELIIKLLFFQAFSGFGMVFRL